MNDKKLIYAGLSVFLVLVLFPLWFTNASGKTGYIPSPVLPQGQAKCIESREFMRDQHMSLLLDWRDQVVREGKRIYVASDGTPHVMSLTSTCLKCHENKQEFCDQCHNYVGLTPYCWDCHVTPKGE